MSLALLPARGHTMRHIASNSIACKIHSACIGMAAVHSRQKFLLTSTIYCARHMGSGCCLDSNGFKQHLNCRHFAAYSALRCCCWNPRTSLPRTLLNMYMQSLSFEECRQISCKAVKAVNCSTAGPCRHLHVMYSFLRLASCAMMSTAPCS